VKQKTKKIKRAENSNRNLIYLLLLVIGLPLVVIAANTHQTLVQEAAGPIVITTEPHDELNVTISQKNGQTSENNGDGNNNNNGDESGNSDPGHVCLGSCPNQPKDDNNNDGNNEDGGNGDINCDNGNVNLGDIGPNEHINVNCDGQNDQSDQSGGDGQGKIKTPKHNSDSGTTDSRKESRKNAKNSSGGGGIRDLIRQWIQRFFGR
jgi:hypothetical protein